MEWLRHQQGCSWQYESAKYAQYHSRSPSLFFLAIFAVCPPTHQHIRPWSLQWTQSRETYHSTTGIALLADHGLRGWVRLCRTLDSLLPTHGLLLTTGQRGGRYDPQPVTRSSEWVNVSGIFVPKLIKIGSLFSKLWFKKFCCVFYASQCSCLSAMLSFLWG